MTQDYKRIFRDGLWDNNAVLVQSLALCPALAVTTSATNGLGMGLATLAVMVVTNLLIAQARHIISPEVRIPAFIVLIATTVTVVDMLINAFLHDLYKVLGLFIPLIVTNCIILARAEAFASRNSVLPSLVDAVGTGLGFTAVMMIIGGIRELIGSGTLFANASLLLGDFFGFLELTLIPDYRGYLIMILPPGGFIVTGFVIAVKKILDARAERKATLDLPVIKANP